MPPERRCQRAASVSNPRRDFIIYELRKLRSQPSLAFRPAPFLSSSAWRNALLWLGSLLSILPFVHAAVSIAGRTHSIL